MACTNLNIKIHDYVCYYRNRIKGIPILVYLYKRNFTLILECLLFEESREVHGNEDTLYFNNFYIYILVLGFILTSQF